MKRDMELIRLILLRAEEAEYGKLSSAAFEEEGYTERLVAQHFQIMEEAGLLVANLLDFPEHGGVMKGHVLRLTWEGHEFIAAARSDTIWAKAKQMVLSATGTVTLDALKGALQLAVKSTLGLPGA